MRSPLYQFFGTVRQFLEQLKDRLKPVKPALQVLEGLSEVPHPFF